MLMKIDLKMLCRLPNVFSSPLYIKIIGGGRGCSFLLFNLFKVVFNLEKLGLLGHYMIRWIKILNQPLAIRSEDSRKWHQTIVVKIQNTERHKDDVV